MSAISTFQTVLIFGGTSGIGESFARRFHALGKKVIITGRREARLAALAKELPGLETYVLDNADISNLPSHANALIKVSGNRHGLGQLGSCVRRNMRSLDGFSDEKVVTELNTNLTAPIILSRYFIPHLLSLKSSAGTFLVTGSGLGFVPMGLMPVYCATKAAVHSFLVGLERA